MGLTATVPTAGFSYVACPVRIAEIRRVREALQQQVKAAARYPLSAFIPRIGEARTLLYLESGSAAMASISTLMPSMGESA